MADKRRLKNVKQVALYLTFQQHTALRGLSARTRVPASVYLREAIDDLLAKYRVADSVDALMPPVRTVLQARVIKTPRRAYTVQATIMKPSRRVQTARQRGRKS